MRLLLLAVLGALPACVPVAGAPPTADCPITETSDWAAWVSAMPGPDRPKLIVTGKVTVPTGGYRFQLEQGPLLEVYPPIQQILLDQHPPEGPPAAATQGVVTHEVRGEWPALDAYGGVMVKCGDRVLADIRPVDRAY